MGRAAIALGALGGALAGGLVAGVLEGATLANVGFSDAGVRIRYVAALALIHGALGSAAGLGVAALLVALRSRDAWLRIAPPIAGLLAPLSVHAVEATHEHWFDRTGFLAPGSLLATAGILTAAVAVGTILAAVLARRAQTSPARARAIALAGAALGVAGAAAALAITALPGAEAATGAQVRNVVLVSIDSLRRDVFDEYLHDHASDELRGFVGGARRFSNAHTSFSHSLPSHASMFTGLHPPEHGALMRRVGPRNDVGSAIDPALVTVAEHLGSAGWETFAVLSNAWLAPPYGLEAGFQTFVNHGEVLRLGVYRAAIALDLSSPGLFVRFVEERLAAEPRTHGNTRLFVDWLRGRRDPRPFFAFLHFIELHTPNDVPTAHRALVRPGPLADQGGRALRARLDAGDVPDAGMDAVRAHVRSLNVASMARIDAFLAPALRALRETGRLDDTLVILTSDHGENLYEQADDYGHSHAFNVTSAVPLALHVPGSQGAGDASLASLIDLAPTLYAWAGVAPPGPLPGRNLLGPTPAPRWIYMQGWDARGEDFARALVSASGYRILRHADGREALYDQTRDPLETDDLAADRPALLDRHRRQLDAALDAMHEADDTAIGLDELAPDVRERLRRLGYVE